MAQNQGMGLPQEFHEQIVNASCTLLSRLWDVLRPSPTPGRCHYRFNLRDITRVFQVQCWGVGQNWGIVLAWLGSSWIQLA